MAPCYFFGVGTGMVQRETVLTARELQSAHAKFRRQIARLNFSIREAKSWIARCDAGVRQSEDDYHDGLLTAAETQDDVAHFLSEKSMAIAELREAEDARVGVRAALARLR